ncbi:unnamed protein product [Adineta steineri]|uniref:NAD(P)(+)--arginine ADP-ribosyltransferase n=1 Tax=Adineta steineri TaxID=433720 RepID=A0A819RKQ7_9BILA|nr:unnamed protein product [Adineta steineri]CAF4046447.1 unnamed protein product [Adineta steineri]
MANNLSSDIRIDTIQLYGSKLFVETHSTVSNSEDSIVVWLNSRKELGLDSYLRINAEIRSVADYLQTFTDNDECVDFISSLTYEKVFLIIYLTEAEQVISLVHDLSQLVYIYVCKESEEDSVSDSRFNWINGFPLVRAGIHNTIGDLLDQLQRDIKSKQSCVVPYSLLWTDTARNQSVQDLNTEQTTFRWNQLLLAALRKLPQNDRSKQDIINECKTLYHNNESELKKIEEFEKTYPSESAVWWYTRECFLYKLLNRALRTEDIDIVFKFRFFIIDLYNQLTDLHNQLKFDKSNYLTVYRGQQLTQNELQFLKLNINSFISMNTFLSTTINKEAALMFAGDGSERPQIESVIFEIIIDISKSDRPVADISKLSHMQHEDEVLLSMSMIFKINSVEQIDNNVWKVKITSINEMDIKLNTYHKYLREKIDEHDDPLLQFGSLLFQMGQYDKEEKYYLMVLDEGTDCYAAVYNNLGHCYYAKHNYRRALEYYTKSINQYVMEGHDQHPFSTQTYNNIGLIYRHADDYKQALNFHYKALEIHQKNPTKNIEGFILTLDHIGRIYGKCDNYYEALKMYSRALNIIHTHLPGNHPYEGMVYDSIGSIYLHLGQYDEAMKNLQKALRIEQEALPNGHIHIASTMISLGLLYDLKAEYDHALNHYNQANNILTKRGTMGRIELATVYGNMGIVYNKKGEYSLALDYHQKCLEIRKQFCSKHTKSFSNVYMNIGTVYLNMHNFEKSVEYSEKALNIILNSQHSDDVDLGVIYNNLGSAYMDLKNTEQALYYYKLSLDIKYRKYPANHPSIGCTLDNIAVLLTRTGDILMAIDYQEKALKIFEQTLGVNHPTTIHCMIDLEILKKLYF